MRSARRSLAIVPFDRGVARLRPGGRSIRRGRCVRPRSTVRRSDLHWQWDIGIYVMGADGTRVRPLVAGEQDVALLPTSWTTSPG